MPERRHALLLFLGVLGVYLTTYNGYLNIDAEGMYSMVESLVERRSFEVEDSPLIHGCTVVAPDGRRYAWYQPGQPLLSIPFYLAARELGPLLPGAPGLQRRFAVGLFSPIAAAAAVAYLYLIVLQLGYPRRTALAMALLLAFASILWPYSKRYFRESFLALCCLGVFLGCVREVQTGQARCAWRTGAWMGIFLLTKLVGVLFIPVVLAGTCIEAREGSIRLRHGLLGRVTALCVFPAIAIACLFAYNELRFGEAFRSGEVVDFSTPLLVGLHGFLFSPGRSVFFYSPILCVALLGLVALWRRSPYHVTVVLGGLAGFLLFHCKLHFPTVRETFGGGGGACWGPRYTVPIVPLLLLPLAEWMRIRPRSRILAGVAVLSIIVQLLAVTVYNRATIGPRRVKGVELDQEDFYPQYCPITEHCKALFQVKFDRVDPATIVPGQIQGEAFRLKNDGITCWWMFLYRLGFPVWVLLAPIALLVPSMALLARLWRSSHGSDACHS